MRRGDVIGVDFPFSDGLEAKRRPAVVVQADAVKTPDVVIAGISKTPSNTSVRLEPTSSGLKEICYVRCEKIHTIERTLTYGTVSHLSAQTMKQVNECLRKALAL